ncbi:lasso peptide biosynthesis B2 protein [Leptolyngbya sp. AN02str]|uniref:lasso peptide biosynthesis B2 protein n=1 Tax=Leptolyngbya sp. AN02str TaxID=3423363 RepID=UPI003D30F992
MQWLYKLFNLSWKERALLLETLFLIAGFKLALWALPFRFVQQFAARPAQSHARSSTEGSLVFKQVLQAVEMVTWHIPGRARCLVRALTTQVLLSRRGYKTDLRIGVSKDAQGNVEAHAWLEYNGQLVIGGVSGFHRYTPLSTL